MKAYKGFGKDMRCKDFQYEENKTYELPKGQEASLCNSGFHACEDPLDCFRYYAPSNSLYHEVELDATEEYSSDDSKRVGKRITIGAALNVKGLIEAHVKYVKERITNEHNAEPGKPATAGDSGAATAGDSGAATAGSYGAATSRGKASVGKNGIACTRGNGCTVKGGMGAVLLIGEEADDSYDLVAWKAVVVDGETIKPDVWYKLVNGDFVEA